MSRSRLEDSRTPNAGIYNSANAQGGAISIVDGDDYIATTGPLPSSTTQHEMTTGSTIIIKTHDGEGYVLPHLPWEMTQSHIEDIYRLQDRETIAEAVKKGKLSLKTEDGNIILPSLWTQLVKPGATVQVVLPSEVLNPDITEHYRYEDDVPRSRYRSRSQSTSRSPDRAREGSPRRARARREGGYVHQSRHEDSDESSSGSREDLDIESISSGSDISESSIAAVSTASTVRQVNSPTDEDGNNLVFKASTTSGGSLDRMADGNVASNKRDPQRFTGETEIISIAKAVSSQTPDRTWLQLFLLKGPRNSTTSLDESIRWFHLRSSTLEISAFRETCLGISGLSKRLQQLVNKTFDKIEKEKVRVSLDGLFIESGTVLRADESNQSDPESVIFSCVPYFALQTPNKRRSNTGQVSGFPPRTLMQSYYPYEPVQDRDAEQAYRRYGNEQRDALVHVPNLWMMNIGPNIVATCSPQALQDGFVQSIRLISIDQNSDKDDISRKNIKLTDWEGRKLLFPVEDCRSYFQMEQKLRELRWSSNRRNGKAKSLQLSWRSRGDHFRVQPTLWTSILKQEDSLFIDLSVTDDMESVEKQDNAAYAKVSNAQSTIPFFQWPQRSSTEDAETKLLLSDEAKRLTRCLELVEKAITSEVLRGDESYSAVEKTFTSTEYYRALPESTLDSIQPDFQALQNMQIKLRELKGDEYTSHRAVVLRQQNAVAQKTSELCDAMRLTLALFVSDVDQHTMLRKAWAAMQSICKFATLVLERKPQDSEIDELVDEGRSNLPATSRRWYIRPDISNEITLEPLLKLKKSFRKCRKCRSFEIYKTSQAALLHAEKHFKRVDPLDPSVLSPKDCIVSRTQMVLEVFNKGAVDIMTTACEKAQYLFAQAQELPYGVINEDGQMSDMYTLPRSLLGAFRQLLVFYFAVERAMFHGEESFRKATEPTANSDWESLISFSSSLQAIESFAGGVEQALMSARGELCSMVKSSGPVEIFKRLSLSPEYVCSWFMRRLIVKPLEQSMTLSDMYREYLSTIQFQVNHRPSKRLLRSINLLQEEIAALQEVNTQQSKLISNYMNVLDDTTYEKGTSYRKAMFPYERMLLESCLDNLKMTDQECRYLLARCGPLSDSTKQSLEINEEDHGKAILVFTVVTVIFLPLSFVTSYLGMNTTDIRDMGSNSTLFWAIAIPLTAVTMGSVMYIGYNGDDLRDFFNSLYRKVTGKQDRSISARGISVAQRKMARKSADTSSAMDFSSLADEAEFANPRPENYQRSGFQSTFAQPSQMQYSFKPPALQWEPHTRVADPLIPELRTGLRTQPLRMNDDSDEEWYAQVLSRIPKGRKAKRRTSEYSLREDYVAARPPAPSYERTRRDSRPEATTYIEPISLDIPPTPASYVRRTRHGESGYTRRPTGRGSEVYSTAAPHYEWTKQRHRHQRSTRRPRRRSRSRDDTD